MRGTGGGHQKVTLYYRGEGGGLGSPKKNYVIFELVPNNATKKQKEKDRFLAFERGYVDYLTYSSLLKIIPL